ncbi:MAG: DUF192 domain-containing protein [Candidatus Hydrogenedentota bacterium]
MKILNRTRNTLLGDRIELADSFDAKLMGLMGRAKLDEGEGLLLKNTPSIHMCFMRFPIDAIFLDGEGRIVRICARLRPWLGLAGADARDCLELPAGTAESTGCAVGDELELTG